MYGTYVRRYAKTLDDGSADEFGKEVGKELPILRSE
jgi:hypothetical protein